MSPACRNNFENATYSFQIVGAGSRFHPVKLGLELKYLFLFRNESFHQSLYTLF